MALKTNSKEVKKYFDKYLQDWLADRDNDSDEYSFTLNTLCEEFYNATCNSVGGLYGNYETFPDAFRYFSQEFEIDYYGCRKVLKEALQETDTESEKYDNDAVKTLFANLLYQAINRACRKEGYEFTKYFKL